MDRLQVYSPNEDSFNTTKWFLYRRRNDAIRLIQSLATSGNLVLPSSSSGATNTSHGLEIAFCPRDCIVGGMAHQYSGMPMSHQRAQEEVSRMCSLLVSSHGCDRNFQPL